MTEPGLPPGVTYVMPILNEVGYVEAAVKSVLAQEYDGPVEIILALAPSTDGTDQVVARLAAADDRIRVVPNPKRHIPVGVNLGIAEARYPVVIRIDAHTELPEAYTARGVAELEQSGAANLGGIMSAVGRPGFQAAAAKAYNSNLGLGGASYHAHSAEPGPAESAYMGIMRTDAIRSIGGFDETVLRGEDWEMNFRLREAGHLVWLDPRLKVNYWPRDKWRNLAKQFFATGNWRAEIIRRHKGRNPLRFFAPPLLVVNFGLALLVGILQALGLVTGWLSLVLSGVYAGPLAYALLLLVAMVTTSGSLADRVRFAVVLATMHLCWGAGFLRGALRGGAGSLDRSRH
ncbi:MAG: glycosyltransferase family 2 protein [Aeromicrobium sp.]